MQGKKKKLSSRIVYKASVLFPFLLINELLKLEDICDIMTSLGLFLLSSRVFYMFTQKSKCNVNIINKGEVFLKETHGNMIFIILCMS